MLQWSVFCANFWDLIYFDDKIFIIFIKHNVPDFLFLNFIYFYVYVGTYGSIPSKIYIVVVIIMKFSHIKELSYRSPVFS